MGSGLDAKCRLDARKTGRKKRSEIGQKRPPTGRRLPSFTGQMFDFDGGLQADAGVRILHGADFVEQGRFGPSFGNSKS
jgi:hypothetical protein